MLDDHPLLLLLLHIVVVVAAGAVGVDVHWNNASTDPMHLEDPRAPSL